MANENLDSIGSDGGKPRNAARTAERFPIEYELITAKDVEILRPIYLEARTAERVDGPAGAIGGGDAFLAMGVPQAQIMMYQQTMRAIKSLEDKLDDVLKAMGSESTDDKKANKAMCVDLSSGGMRMITAQQVKRGVLAKLTLTLPPLHPVIVVAVGKIVKASPIRLSSGKRATETAISFEVINEDDREEIVAYSFKRQRQEAARALSAQDDDDY
jgi:hypothetical protein